MGGNGVDLDIPAGGGRPLSRPPEPGVTGGENAEAALAPDAPGGLRLGDRQRRLLEALAGQSELLRDLYRSGREILGREELPDHPALVAHEFRELMEKLPNTFDLPVHQSVQLRVRMRELAGSLEKAKVGSPSHDGERWDGQIDDSLRAFLSEADRHFEQVEAELR